MVAAPPRPIKKGEKARAVRLWNKNIHHKVFSISYEAARVFRDRGIHPARLAKECADLASARKNLAQYGEGIALLTHYVRGKGQMRVFIVTRAEERSIRIMIGKTDLAEDISELPLVPKRSGRNASRNHDAFAIYDGEVKEASVGKSAATMGSGTSTIFPSPRKAIRSDLAAGRAAFYELEISNGVCELYSTSSIVRIITDLDSVHDGPAVFVTRSEEVTYDGIEYTIMVGDLCHGKMQQPNNLLRTVALAINPPPNKKKPTKRFALATRIVEHRASCWRGVFSIW